MRLFRSWKLSSASTRAWLATWNAGVAFLLTHSKFGLQRAAKSVILHMRELTVRAACGVRSVALRDVLRYGAFAE